jgi:hypothetical protein
MKVNKIPFPWRPVVISWHMLPEGRFLFKLSPASLSTCLHYRYFCSGCRWSWSHILTSGSVRWGQQNQSHSFMNVLFSRFFFAFCSRKPVSCISSWHWQMGFCSKIQWEGSEMRDWFFNGEYSVMLHNKLGKVYCKEHAFFKIHSFLWGVYLVSLVSCVCMPYYRLAILKAIIILCFLCRSFDIYRIEGCFKWKLSAFDATAIFLYAGGFFF